MKVPPLHPIGVVRSPVGQRRPERWEEVVAQVEVEEAYAGALEGLEEFSHIWVLFALHHSSVPESLKTHPQGREDLPLVGLFATRSPRRPNPLAMTAVRLLERRGRVLTVQGLDAFDGTPVLDVKPYLPVGDSIPDARTPAWVQRLHEGRTP